MTYRVLVTGSRDWTDWETIHNQLGALANAHPDLLVVHGACPTGADLHAAEWARVHDIPQEPHPADWQGLGRAAGPLRNSHMLGLGAELCLAFIGPCTSPRCHRPDSHPSHGASSCAAAAEIVGIPVRRWTA